MAQEPLGREPLQDSQRDGGAPDPATRQREPTTPWVSQVVDSRVRPAPPSRDERALLLPDLAGQVSRAPRGHPCPFGDGGLREGDRGRSLLLGGGEVS
jgi:hypothetical protein